MDRLTVLGLFGIGLAAAVWPRIGGELVLGAHKEELVGAYGKAGLDVARCRSQERTLLNPGGGMPDCLQDTFRDAARKLKTEPSSDAPVGEPELP